MGAKKKYRVYKKGGESFKPHMMYNPKTGEGFMAQEYQDHLRMDNMGYGHEPIMRMGGMPCYECGGGVHYEYGGSTAPQNTSTDTIGQQRKDLMKNYMAGNVYMSMLDDEKARIEQGIQNFFAAGGSTYNPNLYGQAAYVSAIDAQKKQWQKDVKGFGKALIDTAAIVDKHRGMNQQQQAAQPQNKPLTFSPQSTDAMPNTGFGSKQPDMFGRNTDQSFGQGNPMTLGADFNKPVGGFNPDLYMAYGGYVPMAQVGLNKRAPYTEGWGETAEQFGQSFINPNAGKPGMPWYTTPGGWAYKAAQEYLSPVQRQRLIEGVQMAEQSRSPWQMFLPMVGQQIVDYYNPPPVKPTEPTLPENPTQQDVQNYQRAKAQYEDDIAQYKTSVTEWAAKTGRMPQKTFTPPKDPNLKATDNKKVSEKVNEKVSEKTQKKAAESTEGKTPAERKEIENAKKEVEKATTEVINETQPNYTETDTDVVTTDGVNYYQQQMQQPTYYGGPGFKYKVRGSYIDPETGKRVRVREKFKSPTGGDFFGFGRSGSPRKIKNTYNIYNNPYMYQMPGLTTATTPTAENIGLTPEQIAGRAAEEQYGQYLRAMQDDTATAEAREAADMEAMMDQYYMQNAPMGRIQPRGLMADQYNPQPIPVEPPMWTKADYMNLPSMQEMGSKGAAAYNIMNNPELFNILSNIPMPNFGYGGNIPMAQIGLNNQFSEDRYGTFLDDVNAAVSQGFTQPASTLESTYTTGPDSGSYVEDGKLMVYDDKPERVGRVKEKVKRQGTGMGRDIAATMLLPTANVIAGLAENAQMQEPLTDASQVFTPNTNRNRGFETVNKGQVDPMNVVAVENPGYNQGAVGSPFAYGRYGGGMPEYRDGGVYDLTPEEIKRVLAMGGSIEYM